MHEIKRINYKSKWPEQKGAGWLATGHIACIFLMKSYKILTIPVYTWSIDLDIAKLKQPEEDPPRLLEDPIIY